ncbi:hypothetical protein KDW_26700 [Dictyobacter vulcani]|uniref:NodB homology domain-containing protein n=2 Tax=Dictyobacter vulcani TaxID=2607529 RepID=A0A5J4KG30_9CHLR|nr:hypothetical protein KDW_26700 [Dictyobacter vulcani]
MGEDTESCSRLFLAKTLLSSSCVLFLLAGILAGYLLLAPNKALPVAAKPGKNQQIQHIAQRYLGDLLQQNYSAMWTLLHPDLQRMWPDKSAFSTYLYQRFHALRLKSFKTGQVSDLSFWTNPETMKQYNHVSTMPVSLDVEPADGSATGNSSATTSQIQQLFRNLPFMVQYTKPEAGQGGNGTWRILDGGPADLEAPILPPAIPITKKITVPILMYHYISTVPARDKANPHSYRPGLSVSPTVFSQQLDYFTTLGYHSITFNQLFDALYYDGPLPTRPIIFSFDDGYVDAYTNAYPILKTHGYSGMFYIITGKVGWEGQASWSQLQEMAANGMQMGSHTIDHHPIGDVWQRSPSTARDELERSRQDLEGHLHMVIQQFCYPSGDPLNKNPNLTITQIQIAAVMSLLQITGYVGAVNDPRVDSSSQDSSKPYIMHRIRVIGSETIENFKKEMAAFVS